MMTTQPFEIEKKSVTRVMSCACCQQTVIFEYHGALRWPKPVAMAMNSPEITHIWKCTICHTTVCGPPK